MAFPETYGEIFTIVQGLQERENCVSNTSLIYCFLQAYLSKPVFPSKKNVFESKESDDLDSCSLRFDCSLSFKGAPPVNGAATAESAFLRAFDIEIKLCLQNIQFVRLDYA